MRIHGHVAKGVGDLMPGWFPVPQNPIKAATSNYVPHIGEILPSRFSVPENPLIRALRGGGMRGVGGCCCGGDGPEAKANGDGYGYINGQPMTDPASGMLEAIDWGTLGMGLLLGWFVFKAN